jgi:hypothetical protein
MEGKKMDIISYVINWAVAPHDWESFQAWHKAACPNDPLSVKERFLKEGGVIHDVPGTETKK